MTPEDNGTCAVEFEEPLIVMRMLGTPGAAEMRRVLGEIEEKTKNWRFNITLVDLTQQLHPPSVETRKAIADASRSFAPSRGTALFGTTFAMRTLGALVMNVISIKTGTRNNSRFFSTEAEARAWLKEQAASET